MYNGHHFGGMHFFWWIFWIIVLIWVFASPYNFLRQRTKNETSLDILKKRFAKGEITKEEFEEKKKFLEEN